MLRPLPRALLALALAGTLVTSRAAEPVPAPSSTHIQRADKICASLAIPDPDQQIRIRDLVARQYRDLGVIHSTRDAAVIAAKESSGKEAAIAAARDTASAHSRDLHFAFLAALSVELGPAQIEQIKDGMTYGVAPLTFAVYQEMLPDLSEPQKRQILSWLREAREHAMDAGSAEEKHACFGKYKGRINNYLSAGGIDMKQAEREMFARRKNDSAQ